jgi:hypothetical protein
MIRSLDNQDKQFFIASIAIPILLWWVFTGRKKYSAKGMR